MAKPSPAQRAERRLVVGIIVGAAVTTLGPLIGLMMSMWGVSRAFEATSSEGVDPSQKARVLAQGISEAMNFSVLAAILSMIGFAIASTCAILLWRRRRAASP